MGMSGDYRIAIEEGSTLVRIGSLLFGSRTKTADKPELLYFFSTKTNHAPLLNHCLIIHCPGYAGTV
jgi:hypothetical protein